MTLCHEIQTSWPQFWELNVFVFASYMFVILNTGEDSTNNIKYFAVCNNL